MYISLLYGRGSYILLAVVCEYNLYLEFHFKKKKLKINSECNPCQTYNDTCRAGNVEKLFAILGSCPKLNTATPSGRIFLQHI